MATDSRADIKAKAFLPLIREWMSEALQALLLVMLFKTFVAEPFRVPSGSMSPTLIGTEKGRQTINHFDVDRDGRDDMILTGSGEFNVYRKESKGYQYIGDLNPGADGDLWTRRPGIRQDFILAAKFLYWFGPPNRGDIAVFKVPENLYEGPEKATYVKRVIGLPGETISFEPTEGVPGHEDSMGKIVVNGRAVESPTFFEKHLYEYRRIFPQKDNSLPVYAEYKDEGYGWRLLEARVPQNMVYVFGDNTIHSLDSRYWGGVPLDHLRGRAIFRFFFRSSPMFEFLL